jgi:hypothetical protein
MKNKKGLAPLLIIVIVLVTLWIIIWGASYLPFLGMLSTLKDKIYYWVVLMLYIGIQVGAVYVFYKIVKWITKLVKDYKRYILQWDLKIKQFLIRT